MSSVGPAAPVILIVEDDEDDLFFARRTLAKAGLAAVHHAADGRVALDYLAGRDGFTDRALHPLPDIVLVDLKLPHINGHQVLEWIAGQPALKHVQAYALSSSGEARDRTRAREAGATGYFVKPLTAADVETLLTARPPR